MVIRVAAFILLFPCAGVCQENDPLSIPEPAYTEGKEAHFSQVLFAPADLLNGIRVVQYSKLEIGVELPEEIRKKVKNHISRNPIEERLNPFDPNEIRVNTVFKHVTTGRTISVDGFYYEPFRRSGGSRINWLADTTGYDFRVRFAHGDTGIWETNTTILTGKELLRGASFRFHIVPSGNPGYVIQGSDNNLNDRYLRFENGNPFIPIGETVGYIDWSRLTPTDQLTMERYMSEIKDAGGNLIRLWMNVSSYLIEREKLGDYGTNYSEAYGCEINRQINAWELDRSFEFAEKNGLYVMLAAFGSEIDKSHPRFGPQPLNWDFNPYRKELGLTEPYEIFESETAMEYQKRRLRYILARWGYSTAFAICEIIGEPAKHKADGDPEARKRLENWINQLSDLVHNHAFPKLTLIDFATCNSRVDWRRNYWKNTSLDIASVNHYDMLPIANYRERWKRAHKFRESDLNYKPFLICEFGASHTPNLDYATDIEMHNTLWSSMFNSSCGPAIPYWWDRIHAEGAGHQNVFKALANFVRDMDLTHGEFSAQKWNDGWKYEGIVCYAIVSAEKDTAFGWAHNTDYWWPNMAYRDKEVKLLLDSCSGRSLRYPDGNFVDKYDNVNYCNPDKFPMLDQYPEHVSGKTIRIENLRSFSTYRIEWHSTHGEGGHLKQFDQIKSSGFGFWGNRDLIFDFPALDNTYGYQDFAFRIFKIS